MKCWFYNFLNAKSACLKGAQFDVKLLDPEESVANLTRCFLIPSFLDFLNTGKKQNG